MLKRIVILSLLCGLASGCIKEDLSSCSSTIRLYFRYTHNTQGQDQLSAQVRDIRIYLFDYNTGILSDIIRAGREDIARGWIEPDVREGTYTAVAWGASGTDLMQGGYHEAEMTDPAEQSYIPQARIGITTVDNFRMVLAGDPLPEGSIGQLSPRMERFDDLFASAVPYISVIKGKKQTAEFDFIKYTNTLKVRITGIEHLTTRAPMFGQPLNVFVTAPNERYKCDNSICSGAREVRYEPPCKALTVSAMETDIKVQRLDIAYHALRPVLLYIQDPGTGQDVLTPIDVMDAILRAEDGNGNLLWQTQRDVDCEDEFPFEVTIRYDMSVTVTVNGFEVVDLPPNIGRD